MNFTQQLSNEELPACVRLARTNEVRARTEVPAGDRASARDRGGAES